MYAICAGTKRRGVLFLRVLALGLGIGAYFGGVIGFVFGQGPLGAARGAVAGIVNTLIVTSVIAGGEIFLPQTRLGRALDRVPFLVTVAVKGIVYGAVIALVFGSNLGRRAVVSALLTPDAPATALQSRMMPRLLAIAIAFSLSLSLIFVLQMSRLIGERTLLAIFRGRYHRAVAEDRFFLFVDIAGSTPLAERLGPAAVHRFLREVFRLASDPIDDHWGEVYQYVGDEIVITWTVADGRVGARPAACFFAIAQALARAGPSLETEFGMAPSLRAALHAGPVIAGEVGGSRRAIVYHGDVMNTTSRMEQATRELKRQFLISGDALERLADLQGFAFEDLGLQQLRGRAVAIRIYAVTTEPSTNGQSTISGGPALSNHGIQPTAFGRG